MPELTSTKEIVNKCFDCLSGKIPPPKSCSSICGMYKHKSINSKK